jgi:hypothetical protein
MARNCRGTDRRAWTLSLAGAQRVEDVASFEIAKLRML